LDAKKEAELLLTDAVEWIDERMRAAAEAAAAIMLIELREEKHAAQKSRRALIHAAWLVSGICLAAVSSLGGFVLATLR
jgi:hypothetical protein